MKKNFHILVFITIFIIIFSSITFAAESAKIQVKVIVPPMQELTVTEAVGVSFSYPWEGMEDGQALVFENIGNIGIKSNVDWLLNINSLEIYRDLEIYIRPHNIRNADWQRIDGSAGLLSGEFGSRNLSWDLKIVQSRSNYSLSNRNSDSNGRENTYNNVRSVNMMFTLTQL